jgi:uncharacterized protein YndB with AHSA1/START domain
MFNSQDRMSISTDDTITIETSLPVPIERVWKAWTDPILILNWFGSDPNGTGVKAKMDVRPGGAYEITFANSDQAEHTCFGVYFEVSQFNKLSFSWTWKNEPNVESLVTVELTSGNDHTRMRFEHAHVGTESAHNYLAGWESTFAKLERLLTRQ